MIDEIQRVLTIHGSIKALLFQISELRINNANKNQYVSIQSNHTVKKAMSNTLVTGSLHSLLSGKKWQDVEALINSTPSLAFEVGGPFNTLPLVTALMNRPPLWLVDSIIDANPAAVNTNNEYGMLPIRVAIRSECSTDVIKSMIRENQDCVRHFGVSGKTCLHLACLYGGDLELIEHLLEVWPEATEWRDRDGW